jgi:hypothetical protein
MEQVWCGGTSANNNPTSSCITACAYGAAAGKTTLLQLLAGKYMVPKQVIRVLGESPFYDMVGAAPVVCVSAAAPRAAPRSDSPSCRSSCCTSQTDIITPLVALFCSPSPHGRIFF